MCVAVRIYQNIYQFSNKYYLGTYGGCELIIGVRKIYRCKNKVLYELVIDLYSNS